MIRVLIASVLTTLACMSSVGSHAQTYPPDALLSGQISQVVVNQQCYVLAGNTEFQRNAAGPIGVISTPELVADGYQLGGQIILELNHAGTGNALPKAAASTYPTAIRTGTLSGYNQSYNGSAQQFSVKFTLTLGGCTLPINAIYKLP